MPERIGFVSTRFAGTDGVSLESEKWAEVLADYRHESFWFAGRIDRHAERSMCVPEAFFGHPANNWINDRVWGRRQRPREASRRIHVMAEYLKGKLYEFVKRFDISILVAENALTIPMHVPLGLALTEFLSETRIPAIAHHHDSH